MKEWVKYSAYGIPFGLPGGDTDSDGDCDTTDVNQVQTWINGSTYDVRGDIDLDGDVDATDKSTIQAGFSGLLLGRLVLSSAGISNSFGLGGYSCTNGNASYYSVRMRVLQTALGHWLTRDSIVQTGNLYAYPDNPITALDPLGLFRVDLGPTILRMGCPTPAYVTKFYPTVEASDLAGHSADQSIPHQPILWFVQKVEKDASVRDCIADSPCVVGNTGSSHISYLEAAPVYGPGIVGHPTVGWNPSAGGDTVGFVEGAKSEGGASTTHYVKLVPANITLTYQIYHWGNQANSGTTRAGPYSTLDIGAWDHLPSILHGAYQYSLGIGWECCCGHTESWYWLQIENHGTQTNSQSGHMSW